MPTRYPQSTEQMFLQPNGVYQLTASGVLGETVVNVPITDAVCLDDLDANGNETTSDLQALGQDLYHVLKQRLGSNLDAPDDGIGIEDNLSGSTVAFAAKLNLIDRQFESDDRVSSSRTVQTKAFDGTPIVTISVLPVGSILPYQFQWSQTQGVAMLGGPSL